MKQYEEVYQEGYEKGYTDAMTEIIEKILDMSEERMHAKAEEGNNDAGKYKKDSRSE